MHCEPKHLSLREIKLARYLISTYSGTRTVEVHSVTHADPAYSRSNAGQRLQHTLAYNPHRCLLRCTYVCMCVCVWQRKREREREKRKREGESSGISRCVSTAVVWLFCDSPRPSAGNAPRCGQSQLNFFYDKDRFFFFPERPDSPSIQYHNASAEVWSVRQSKPENVVYILTVHLEKNCF